MQTQRNRKTAWKLWQLGLCFSLLLGVLSGIALGQAVYGSIFGTVTDAQGAAVPKATVTITDLGKNLTFSTETNASGNFNYADSDSPWC